MGTVAYGGRQRVARTVFVILVAILGLIRANDYRGYKVYEVLPDDPSKDAFLQTIKGIRGYDFWTHPRGNASQIMVAPEQQGEFEDLMNKINIDNTVMIENVEDFIRESGQQPRSGGGRRAFSRASFNAKKFRFDRFLRYPEMVAYMRFLVKGRTFSELIKLGKSSEGRSIIGIKIGSSDKNPVIFVDGGIHAREWAAPITVLYIIKKIVENEKHFAKYLTIYITPCVNPDGYEYTHTHDRLWRKTRSDNGAGEECKGADANRNFDSHWAEMGAEQNPCSGTYPGAKPFSEPESQAIRDAILAAQPAMYLTFHSYGPLMLYPWGFTTSLPSNWQMLDSLAHKAADAIRKIHGREYTIGSSTNVLYAASGGSDDWAMQKVGVPYVYTIELPDYGKGFELPPNKIKAVVAETWEGFLVLADFIEKEYGNH